MEHEERQRTKALLRRTCSRVSDRELARLRPPALLAKHGDLPDGVGPDDVVDLAAEVVAEHREYRGIEAQMVYEFSENNATRSCADCGNRAWKYVYAPPNASQALCNDCITKVEVDLPEDD